MGTPSTGVGFVAPKTSGLLSARRCSGQPTPESSLHPIRACLPPPRALGPVREQVLLSWRRSVQRRDKRPVMIFAQYGAETSSSVRPDILALLRQYRKHFYVVVVAATPSLLQNESNLTPKTR